MTDKPNASAVRHETAAGAHLAEPYIPLVRPFLPPLDRLLPLLQEIWARGHVTNDGPVQRRFEAALADRLEWQNVVATANGTLALQLACRALGLDGEVIAPAFTFPATVQALLWNGLIPVLVDVEPEHLTIDMDAVSAAVTTRTTAIIAVHTFGHPADVLALQKIAERHGLALVYDAAPAVGVRIDGEPVTNFGDVSAVSFHATKVMHTVEGGAVVTPHDRVAETVRRLRNFGLSDSEPALPAGTNAKLNELQAAMGLLGLDELASEITSRADSMQLYSALLAGIPGIRVLEHAANVQPNYAYAIVRLRADGRPMADLVHRRLQEARIDSRRYFARRFQVAKELPRRDTPVADAAARDVLCLPLWAGIPRQVIQRVSLLVKEMMT